MRPFLLASLTLIIVIQPLVNGQSHQGGTYYDLSSPDKYYILPGVLNEISGIVNIDGNIIAGIQDENGVVFFYDLLNKKISRSLIFFENGDYEDIATAGKSMYILRSDGVLFEIADFTISKIKVNVLKTGIPSKESEALCYHKKNNSLLIAAKENVDSESLKGKRVIYSFNMATRKLDNMPFLIIDPGIIPELLMKTGQAANKNSDDNDDQLDFRISAISIHPLTGNIWALSAGDRILCEFDNRGTPLRAYPLNKKLFNQPEGITFLLNGDMFISNEGGDDDATLLRFNLIK